MKVVIAHSFTKIKHHDPHYVTVPTSVFELIPSLKDEEVELVLAHSIEFTVDRVRTYGVIS